MPPVFSFGFDGKDRDKNIELLFKKLPTAAVQDTTPDVVVHKEAMGQMLHEHERTMYEKGVEVELWKAKQLARLLDLRNANAKGLAFENRRRIIEAFSPNPEEPSTGHMEVQGVFNCYLVLLCSVTQLRNFDSCSHYCEDSQRLGTLGQM